MANTYTPPASLEAEQALLGAILVRPSVLDVVISQVYETDFYRQAHAQIYHAMTDLYGASLPVDLVTVNGYLKDRGQLEGCGGPVYLAGLSEAVGFATNALYYAEKIREKAVLRRLLDASQEIAGGCLARVDDVAEFASQAAEKIFGAVDERGSESYALADLVPGETQKIEALWGSRGRVLGVPSGFFDLDRLTAGFQKSDLIVLAARPSMGKTALALNISFNAANAKTPVAFFSLEMSKEQLVRRYFASEGRISTSRLRTGNMAGEEWARLLEAGGRMLEAPIFISDNPRPTSLEIRAQARRLKARYGIGLVVVDYLQLMRDPKAKSREQEIARISGDLKAIAKELDVPVLALAQLNRDVEKRPNKRPVLSDLRESGALEQDADVVMFIYRDEVYRKDSLEKGVAEVRVAKQRNGPTGLVKLAYLGEYTRFESYSDEVGVG